jgi:hypothetical protein
VILISHRVNTVEQLRRTPERYGVEIGLRDDGAHVVLQHDAFKTGERFDEYLRHYRHRFLILNLKCEGIEEAVLAAARAHGVDDFFVLDASIPAMVKLARRGETRLAVRFSEWEPVELVLAMAPLAQWVWVDCFRDYPPTPAEWETVRRRLRVCLVSPELQGREPPERREAAAVVARFHADAVCSKRPDVWEAAAGAP